MNLEYDKEPCDLYCSCSICKENADREELRYLQNKNIKYLESLGFSKDEDIELSSHDKNNYSYDSFYQNKKIVSIKHITDKAILFEFLKYDAWIPKVVIDTEYVDGKIQINMEAIENRKTVRYRKSFLIAPISKLYL